MPQSGTTREKALYARLASRSMMRPVSVPPVAGSDGFREGFNGPLDMLLQLVQRHELDITAVSLVAIADEYLDLIDTEPDRDPREVGAFVEIGARLTYLKSRALLPPPPSDDDDAAGDLDANPVALELVERLTEYRRFRAAFEDLELRQDEQLRLFPRLTPVDLEGFGPGLGTTTAAQLQRLMLDVLQRKPVDDDEATRPRPRVRRQRVNIREHVDLLRQRLTRTHRFRFREALEACETRAEVIVSFLALLEMLKAGECDARQDALWGDIEIVRLEHLDNTGSIAAAG